MEEDLISQKHRPLDGRPIKKMYPLRLFALLFVMALVFACNTDNENGVLDVVTAEDLEGSYTGVLEAITVPVTEDMDMEDRSEHIIVDVDVLHELTLTAEDTMILTIESPIVPKFRAIVAGIGPLAINLEFVEFTGLNPFAEEYDLTAVKIKQLIFIKKEGEWICVIQMAGISFEEKDLEGVNAIQFISYPSSTAEKLSESEAIQYVDEVLDFVSEAQRY